MRLNIIPPTLSLLGFLAITVPSPCEAQETTGTLEGWLVDEAGKPISQGTVLVTGPSLQGSRSVVSDDSGYFRMFVLPIGVYSVTVRHLDYRGVDFENVSIQLGRTTTLGVIPLHATPVMEPIVVTAERRGIDPSSTTIGANLSTDEFHDLPIDRNYMNIPTLLPDVNESYFGDGVNFAGSTGLENKFFIDGVETTDPYVGLNGTALPYNFVKEVEVRTGGYEAEYRSSLGGVVNVVSRSGGNRVSGQGFGFFLNNQMAGTPRKSFGDPGTGDYAQYDLGLSISGPIKRDKLWYFVAYNPQSRTEDVKIPGQGYYQDKSTSHIFAGKLDWRRGERTKVTLAVMGDPTTRDAVDAPVAENYAAPDPLLYKATTGGVNLLANATHFMGNSFILEVPISYVTRTAKAEAATVLGRTELPFYDYENNVASGGFGNAHENDVSQLTAEIRGTLTAGTHTLKSGIGYREKTAAYRENFGYIDGYSDTSYTVARFQVTDGTVRHRLPSVFLQDSWRASPRLRINAGVRWDAQFMVATTGKVAQKITGEVQPRLGLVYQPGDLGSQKVFGSFGRFYQEMAMVLSVFNHNEYASSYFANYDHDPRVDPSGGANIIASSPVIHPEVHGLEGQYFDEFNLGYERRLGSRLTVGVIGTYRALRQAIEDGYVEAIDEFRYGNPGEGLLSDRPKAKRRYTGLEMQAQIFGGKRYHARMSYVLSRTVGNYPGLFDSEFYDYVFPNYNISFDLPEMDQNGDGLLANDRTHVLKFSGAYSFDFGLTAGTMFSWQSGTPLSVLESATWGYPFQRFAEKRGSGGRTPSIWDLNLRLAYDLSRAIDLGAQPRLILDVFHLGSQRKAVEYDKLTYFNQDASGNQVDPNPTYGQPILFQPPMTVRLGMEVGF